MKTRIIGLDVCKSSVAAWILDERPTHIKSYFRDHKADCLILNSCRDDIDALKTLKPDIIALEPTGVHYSKLWAKAALDMGATVLWVGHSQLKSTRLSFMLPNKNDPADALALALYAHDHMGDPDYFVRFDPFSPGAAIRDHALQLGHIARVQSPIINRIRQNLAHEWPEKMNTQSTRQAGSEMPPSLWRYIAGEPLAKATQTRYDKSLTQTCGSGISLFTRHHASHLCAIHRQEIDIEHQMTRLLADPTLDPYHQVFNRFGMGPRVRAMILGHIYPLENYLAPSRKPITEWVETSKGRRSLRHRSLNAFKLRLGLGLVEDSSGQTSKHIAGGSSLCRKALWQWVFCRIEVKRNRPPNRVGVELGSYCDQLKENGIPVRLVRSRVCVKAAEMLFYELVNAIR